MSARASSPRRSGLPGGRQGLRDKRRKHRRRLLCAFLISVVLLGAAGLYALRQEAIRISHIEIFGTERALAEIAKDAMQGSYLGIIPRDSIIFYPEQEIRESIRKADSDVATVSIFRHGLTGLTIKVSNRVPIARWCGASYAPQVASTSPHQECFVFDDSGVIFATTTAIAIINPFLLYEPLSSSSTPGVGAVIPNAAALPAVFNFARQLATLGSPVRAVALHDREVDAHLTSGTRITYVLGHEQDAYTALLSAKDNLNVVDGSLQYVDLRFDGKMYLKRRGASEQGQ